MQDSRTLLFIHSVCNSLHPLTPNSQSVPPPPLHKSLFYVYESVSVSQITSFESYSRVISHLSDIWYLSFLVSKSDTSWFFSARVSSGQEKSHEPINEEKLSRCNSLSHFTTRDVCSWSLGSRLGDTSSLGGMCRPQGFLGVQPPRSLGMGTSFLLPAPIVG